MIHVISLGAGVQSSTMALMAAHGEITPMPDCAIFADTQSEPEAVYAWLDWLEKQLPFPVRRVSRGNLSVEALRLRVSKGGKTYQKHAVPAFTVENGTPSGLLMRQCTGDFKIDPIIRALRGIRGAKTNQVIQWIGISRDEAIRMKPVRQEHAKWLTSRWPLIELGRTREGCLQWMLQRGYPRPPRSACWMCGFRSNAEWQKQKTEAPAEFAKAVQFDRDYRAAFAQVAGFRGEVYLHRELRPLDEIDFTAPAPQADMFGNECEGMCGV